MSPGPPALKFDVVLVCVVAHCSLPNDWTFKVKGQWRFFKGCNTFDLNWRYCASFVKGASHIVTVVTCCVTINNCDCKRLGSNLLSAILFLDCATRGSRIIIRKSCENEQIPLTWQLCSDENSNLIGERVVSVGTCERLVQRQLSWNWRLKPFTIIIGYVS